MRLSDLSGRVFRLFGGLIIGVVFGFGLYTAGELLFGRTPTTASRLAMMEAQSDNYHAGWMAGWNAANTPVDITDVSAAIMSPVPPLGSRSNLDSYAQGYWNGWASGTVARQYEEKRTQDTLAWLAEVAREYGEPENVESTEDPGSNTVH